MTTTPAGYTYDEQSATSPVTREQLSQLLTDVMWTDDDAAAQAYLAASPIAAKWEDEMYSFFIGLESRHDQAATPLTEVFHLADQLAEAAPAASVPSADAESPASAPTESTRS